MKYMVMLTRAEWEDTAPEAEKQAHYAEIGQWWGKLSAEGKIGEGSIPGTGRDRRPPLRGGKLGGY